MPKIPDHPLFVYLGAVFALGALLSVIFTCIQIVWYLDAQKLAIEVDAKMQENWFRTDKEQYEKLNDHLDLIRQQHSKASEEIVSVATQLNSVTLLLHEAVNRAEVQRKELRDEDKAIVRHIISLNHKIGVHQGHHDMVDRGQAVPRSD